MIQEPLVLPEFARLDYANGPLSENNVLEPSSLKKDKGWDYGEEPDREFFNWIHRYTYLNLQYQRQISNETDNFFFGQW